MTKHIATPEENLEHLATVIWNVLRMNERWTEDDLQDLYIWADLSNLSAPTKDWLKKQIGECARRNDQ